MKKRVFIMVIVIMVIFAMCAMGCSNEERQSYFEENKVFLVDISREDEEENVLGQYIDLVEEYQIRSIIEAVNFYEDNNNLYFNDVKRYENNEKIISNQTWYGSDNFKVDEGLITISGIDNMLTIFNNDDFQNDYFNQFGINVNKYYYLPKNIVIDDYAISLLTVEQEYYFSLIGSTVMNGSNATVGVFDAKSKIDILEIASLYANLDELNLYVTEGVCGDVYFFTTNKKNTLINSIYKNRINELMTVYLWEQERVLGILIIYGEHKAENVDYCVLEKHEM